MEGDIAKVRVRPKEVSRVRGSRVGIGRRGRCGPYVMSSTRWGHLFSESKRCSHILSDPDRLKHVLVLH